jgi:hypothetical protein
MKDKIQFHTSLMILLILVNLLTVMPAFAAGPGEGGRRLQLNDEPAGPYLLRVATSPTPPRVMDLYIEVRVTEAATGAVVEDAQVVIEARLAEDGGAVIRETATHDIAPIPTEYAAHIQAPSAGLWLITIEVDGPIGTGDSSFLLTISNTLSLGWVIAIGAPIAGLAVLILVFFRLQKRTQQEN